jgi:hypothetical protein
MELAEAETSLRHLIRNHEVVFVEFRAAQMELMDKIHKLSSQIISGKEHRPE